MYVLTLCKEKKLTDKGPACSVCLMDVLSKKNVTIWEPEQRWKRNMSDYRWILRLLRSWVVSRRDCNWYQAEEGTIRRSTLKFEEWWSESQWHCPVRTNIVEKSGRLSKRDRLTSFTRQVAAHSNTVSLLAPFPRLFTAWPYTLANVLRYRSVLLLSSLPSPIWLPDTVQTSSFQSRPCL